MSIRYLLDFRFCVSIVSFLHKCSNGLEKREKYQTVTGLFILVASQLFYWLVIIVLLELANYQQVILERVVRESEVEYLSIYLSIYLYNIYYVPDSALITL